jgi:pimeloyl-ACP methyl ester carboxylesterase
MSQTMFRARKCIFAALVLTLVAVVSEEFNRYFFKVVQLYPGLRTAGMLWTIVFAAGLGVYIALQSRLSLLAPILNLCGAFVAFALYDHFLQSPLFPAFDRKHWEWILPLLYGSIFGALSWVILGLTAAITVGSRVVELSKPIMLEKPNAPSVVVFVHGLTGNAITTWGEFPALLHNDTEVCASVFLWGYPTGLFGYFPSVADAAAQLETEIRIRLKSYQNIVLVGHSLGGLVICRFIIDALKAGRIEDINRIKHIVTFATPHDGVMVADVVKFFRLANRQVKNLGLTDETITSLRTEWINRVYNPEIKPGEERTKKRIPLTAVVGLEDRLVPKSSAMAYFVNPPPETVNGNHITLKLPSSTRDTPYILLKNVI